MLDACLKIAPKGGPIGTWDVSRVTYMSRLFYNAKRFCGDLSKWDVSNVKDMSEMFHGANSFNSDVSKWDVSRVTNMPGMFRDARSFNIDISKWDVSRVSNMDYMFRDATLFGRQLCGAAWVAAKASKNIMFAGSPGSISRTVCTSTPKFSPQTGSQLRGAVTSCQDDTVGPGNQITWSWIGN